MEKKKKVQIDEELFYDLVKYFSVKTTNKDIERAKSQLGERIKVRLEEKEKKMSEHDCYTKAKDRSKSDAERKFNLERYKGLKGF